MRSASSRPLHGVRRGGQTRRHRSVRCCVYCDAHHDGDRAGLGVIITDGSGATVATFHRVVDVGSSLEAEYHACLLGARLARDHLGRGDFEIVTDCKTVVRQVQGRTPTRPPDLVAACLALRAQIDLSRLRWVPRAHNRRAHDAARSSPLH